MTLTRRLLHALAPGLAAAALAAFPALAQDGAASPAAAAVAAPAEAAWQTATSLIKPSKYPAGFKHFDYVNVDAPKGGTMNQAVTGSFDTFNPFVVRGTVAAGFQVFGGGLLYDTLLDQSPDEPATSHALIAEALRYPADFSSVTFRLNPAARWHDGQPITVEDVIWSFETLKALHPQWGTYYRNVVKAEKTGEREVTFRFDQANNRELPNIMGDLTVLPRHWWEGTDASGRKRDIAQPTLEPPLGSGPYAIERFQTGRSITWKRVPDYWAAALPVRVGRYNVDRFAFSYYRDENATWEGFKKGGIDDYRIENSSRRWAEGYNFPAAQDGRIIRKTLPSKTVESMQAFVLNNRLPKFADIRVRKALTLAFDFETMNRTLFYGLYKRVASNFANSELAATGLPTPAELRYLEPLRGKIPDEVFTTPFTLPDNTDPAAARGHLREALQLFGAAGYELRGSSLVKSDTGEPFTIEFLGNDPADGRTFDPYIQQLGRIGIAATLRIVDANQYIARLNDFQYDSIGLRFPGQSLSPGNEQRDMWSSQAADARGSRNYAGIKDPAVDALVDDVIFAKDRDDLVGAVRALDRVLLWNRYYVPQWYNPDIWLAYWSKFGIPEKQPDAYGVDIYSWWIKPEAAAAEAGGTPAP